MHCFLTEPPKMLKLQIIASCISAKSKQQRSVMSKINSILMCFRKQKQSWETKKNKNLSSSSLLPVASSRNSTGFSKSNFILMCFGK